jgi:hypothetical protein
MNLKNFLVQFQKNNCQAYEEDEIFYFNNEHNNFIAVYKGE